MMNLVPSQAKPHRIPTLDGWRAVAILMVTLFHLSEVLWDGVRPDLIFFARYGAYGVDIFFGISGLLITTLLLNEWDRTGRIDLLSFYIRRVFRIVVPCYAYILFLVLTGVLYSQTELSASLLFFRNYLDQGLFGPNTVHLWSLAVEEHFYLLWPITLALVTPRYGQLAASWGAVLCALWRTAATANLSGLSNAFPHFRTDYRMDALLWGCAMAFLLRDKKVQTILVEKFRGWHWTALVFGLVACVSFINVTILRTLVPILVAFTLVGTVLHREWAVGRMLEHPFLCWIGRISYSLYLWQVVFLVPLHMEGKAWWQQFPQNLPIMLSVAVAGYYLIERPCMRIGHRLSNQNLRGISGFGTPSTIGVND